MGYDNIFNAMLPVKEGKGRLLALLWALCYLQEWNINCLDTVMDYIILTRTTASALMPNISVGKFADNVCTVLMFCILLYFVPY